MPDYVVKFSEGGIFNEGDTQAFVYAASKSSPGAPPVPQVYDCFTWDGMQNLVMERIDHPSVEAWINDAASEAESQSRFDMACGAVAHALRWLFSLSPPLGAEIGLLEGPFARTQRDLSAREVAALIFDSSASTLLHRCATAARLL